VRISAPSNNRTIACRDSGSGTQHQTKESHVLHCIDLVASHLDDVFGQIDPLRRRAAIDEIFHEDAVSTT